MCNWLSIILLYEIRNLNNPIFSIIQNVWLVQPTLFMVQFHLTTLDWHGWQYFLSFPWRWEVIGLNIYHSQRSYSISLNFATPGLDWCHVLCSRFSFLLELDLLCLSNCCKYPTTIYVLKWHHRFVKNIKEKFMEFFSQIGSFFMINLCLVVIATQFSETKKRETAKMKAERAEFSSSGSLNSNRR